MTIRQRFSDFIESLKEQPRRKFGVVCSLLIFVTLVFLLAGIYFLAGYFTLQNMGPAAEMAADMQDMYAIKISVDTSQYLWWCIPFFLLATGMTVLTVRYITSQLHLLRRAKRPARSRERIRAKRDALVEVRVHTVNPEKAKTEDLRNAPPAWLLDPLAVVSDDGKTVRTDKRETVQQREQRQTEAPQPPFTYADFVQPPYSVSTPHNTVVPPRKKQADIPYAGSLQYVPRPEGKPKSPYAPK